MADWNCVCFRIANGIPVPFIKEKKIGVLYGIYKDFDSEFKPDTRGQQN